MRTSPGQRGLALGVLFSAAGLAILAFPFRHAWWGGLLLAVGEAGVVGGLADWFAVTALFRRPLGLPIPHTALIPANWRLMARRVATMVGDQVLTKEFVTKEIFRVDAGAQLARVAERLTRDDLEAAARIVARWALRQLPESDELTTAVRSALERQPMAPVLARALDVARQNRWHDRGVAVLARVIDEALDRPALRAIVGDIVDELLGRYYRRAGAYPRLWIGTAALFGLLDRDRIVQAVHEGVKGVANDPRHPLRERVSTALAALPGRLRTEPDLAARVEQLKQQVLAMPALTRLVEAVARSLSGALRTSLADPKSESVAWIVDQLERSQHRLVTDVALQRDIDRWVKARTIEIVDRYHAQLALFIENGVHALGADGAVRLIEDHAGEDLQYIRVNGTLVGGLVGGLLYAIHLVLGLF